MKELYKSEVAPALMKEFGYHNLMEVPRLVKISVNIGLGEALQNPKAMDSAAGDIAAISGQKPVITRARRSIANFKVREGNPIGLMVTVRGDRMWEFMDRMVNATSTASPTRASMGEATTVWASGSSSSSRRSSTTR
jgi:large subunit ribosomal protein L5